MFKCPFGFLRAFVYIQLCMRLFPQLLYLFIDDDPRRNFGKNSRLFGTRQFFELLEDSVGMTSCLVFLPYLFYGFPIGFSALFIIFQAPSAWWLSSFLFRLLEPVGLQLCQLVAPFNGRQSLKTVSFFSFGLDDCHHLQVFWFEGLVHMMIASSMGPSSFQPWLSLTLLSQWVRWFQDPVHMMIASSIRPSGFWPQLSLTLLSQWVRWFEDPVHMMIASSMGPSAFQPQLC